jgi:Ca2+-binding EF-hand superfamily protein
MLKEIIFMERELESAKIELSLKPDFNLLDAFKMIDLNNKGWVSFSELCDVLSRLFDIDTSTLSGRELLDLVFKRYDTNRDQKLSLAEFCKAFTPAGKEYGALVQGRAEFYAKRGINPMDFFNSDTRREIRTVWEVLIHTEKMTERLRHKLADRPLFNMRAAFKYVDRDQNGAITHLDLRDSLVSHGFYATEKEIQLIMNKFDKFSDNKITMTDFIDELVPKTRG